MTQVRMERFVISRSVSFPLFAAAQACLALAVGSPFAELRATDFQLGEHSVVRLAEVEAGIGVLSTNDAFIQSLSPFDRQARLESDQPVSTEELLRYIAAQVTPWPDADAEKIQAAVAKLCPRLEKFSLPLPSVVLLIRTTGREEAGAAYTRANAIVLPQNALRRPPDALERLMTHELFHVLSRHDVQSRRKLYAIVGFRPCAAVQLPASLASRKITNPDAPLLDAAIDLTVDGQPVTAVPLLYSSAEQYDIQKKGPLFRYLTFRLLAVQSAGDVWEAVLRGGKPWLLDPAEIPAFHEKIGRNTKYIIHPDEILADNFVHLVFGTTDLATPRILEEMRKVFSREQ